nr:hypothetical protein [Marinomonas ushuaiensis]
MLKGQYPQILKRVVPKYLPAVLPGNMDIISLKIDFLGMNFYT